MEVKNYNFVYQNVEDLEKIDDNESVKDDDESTEDNKSDIDYNRKPKKYKIRNSRKINRLTKTIDEAVCYETNLKLNILTFLKY